MRRRLGARATNRFCASLPGGVLLTRYPLRLAIVGCGAVVERYHLPASLCVPEVEITALVDVNLARAEHLAKRFGVPYALADHRQVLGRADAVLLATPPHLHAAQGCEFLHAGLHLLCEKPLSVSTAEGQAMVSAAAESRVIFAVGHHRRFHPNKLLLKAMVDSGTLGCIKTVHVEDGFPFGWPTYTAFMFDKAMIGGGVLLENGIHVLDLLLWIFGPVVSVTDYRDDALGGLESNVTARFEFEAGVNAEVRISRTATLSNTMRVEGEAGRAEVPLYDIDVLTYAGRDKLSRALGQVSVCGVGRPHSHAAMIEQLRDFARCVRENAVPRVPAKQALQAVALVQRCYDHAANRPLPDVAPLPGVPE